MPRDAVPNPPKSPLLQIADEMDALSERLRLAPDSDFAQAFREARELTRLMHLAHDAAGDPPHPAATAGRRARKAQW